MADDVDFPAELIAAQRTWNAAVEAVADHARIPGEAEDGGWTEEQSAEWWRLQQAQQDATLALITARQDAGADYDTHARRQALKEYVRKLDAPTDGEPDLSAAG